MIDKMSAFHGQSIGPGPSDPVRSPDKPVAVTDTARENGLAGAIDHMVQQGMPIDVKRIQAIRQAIADGQYPVDPMKIAEKMVDFDRSGGDL